MAQTNTKRKTSKLVWITALCTALVYFGVLAYLYVTINSGLHNLDFETMEIAVGANEEVSSNTEQVVIDETASGDKIILSAKCNVSDTSENLYFKLAFGVDIENSDGSVLSNEELASTEYANAINSLMNGFDNLLMSNSNSSNNWNTGWVRFVNSEVSDNIEVDSHVEYYYVGDASGGIGLSAGAELFNFNGRTLLILGSNGIWHSKKITFTLMVDSIPADDLTAIQDSDETQTYYAKDDLATSYSNQANYNYIKARMVRDIIGYRLITVPSNAISDWTFVLNDEQNAYSVTDMTNTTATSIRVPNYVVKKGDTFYRATIDTPTALPVTAIGDYAFEDCINLTQIVMLAEMQELGIGIFSGCSSLTSVTIPRSINFLASDEVNEVGTFSGSSLQNIAFQENSSIESIPAYTFAGVSSLESITFGTGSIIESIGKKAFYGCESLENVTLPSSITSIEDFAFANSSLVTITVPSSVTEIKQGAFSGCSSLSSIYFAGTSLNTLGVSVLDGCSSLISVAIPVGVTSIGQNAFRGCSALESILFSQDAYLGAISDHMFDGCTSFNGIIIPNSVTSIGEYAFKDCTSLTSLTIPNGVTSIDDFAFNNCSNLTSIIVNRSTTNTITSLGSSVFDGSGITATTGIIYVPADSLSAYKTATNWSTYADRITYIAGTAYSITYNENDAIYTGTAPVDLTDQIALPATLPTLTQTGYIFEGWYYDEALTQSATAGTNITANTTLYAKWNSTYSITYVENDAIYTGTAPVDLTYQISLPSTLPTLEQIYYIFDGWYTDADLTISAVAGADITADTTLYAKWTAIHTLTIGELSVTVSGATLILNSTTYSGTSYIIAGSYIYNEVTYTNVQVGDGTDEFDSDVTEIYFNGVITIGAYAFNTVISLTKVHMTDTVTTIGNYAFNGCTNLTDLTLSSNLTSIGQCAFNGCIGLTSISIPASVTTIGISAFYGCTGITSLTFDENSVLTTIYSGAFEDCTSLTSITIPYTVTTIYSAFSGCSNLETITFADAPVGNELSLSVGSSVFSSLENLTTVNFGANSSVTTITNNAFSNCTSLATINWGLNSKVSEISFGAFYNCTGLINLTLPYTITDLSNGFGSLVNLETITFADAPEGNERTLSLTNGIFAGCADLSLVNFGNNSSVTTISNGAFSNCSSLATIDWGFNSKVSEISNGAFGNCTSLIDLYLPYTITDLSNGFGSLTNLETITFADAPEGNARTLSLSSSIFADCSKLISLDFGNNSSVTTITNSAFSNCSSLTTINWGLNSKVSEISNIAFGNCSKLISLDFGNNSSVTTITNSAFSNCTSLATIDFSLNTKLSTIGPYAFYNCTSLATINWGLNSKVSEISYSAFGNCSSLTSFNLPSSLTSIGTGAFTGCTSLTAFALVGTNTAYMVSDGVLYSADGTTLVSYPNGKTSTSYIMPNTITETNGTVFNGCLYLQSITLSSALTSLSYASFCNCDNLTEILVDTSSTSYKSIDGVLYSYDGATLVAYPQSKTGTTYEIPNTVTTIKEYAFYNCSSLTSITFATGSTLTTIGSDAFSECDSLNSIIIPATVNSFEYCAFANCDELDTVTFATGSILTSIEADAFENCVSLTTIVLPTNLTTLGYYVFDGCTSLASITIPSTVTSIGSSAFRSCSSLITVILDSNTIRNTLTSATASGYLIQEATTIYLKTGLTATSYISNNYTSTTTDLDGYSKYVKNI